MTSVKEIAMKYINMIKNMKNLPSDIKQGAIDYIKMMAEMGGLRFVDRLSQTAPALAQIAANVSSGVMTLKVADMLRDMGEYEAASQLLQEMLKMLQQILKNLQTGMTDRDQIVSQLSTLFAKIYSEASRQGSTLSSAILPG